MEILDKFAPSKIKYLRANHSKLNTTKELNKAIIILTIKLRNQFLKTKTHQSRLKKFL